MSELLEKGIYNEETKGDIDAAMAIYQRLIEDAKAQQSLAAQAEFRLAQCYLKKNLKDQATEEFKKLARNYPNEKELIAKASEFLPGAPKLEPAPWEDGERLQVKVCSGHGTEIGIMEYRANLIQSGSGPIWQVGGFMSIANVSAVSCVKAEADSFHPISSRWKHSLLGEVEATYEPGQVVLRRQGRDGTSNVKLDGYVVDNEQALGELRRLPLKVGYKTSAVIFSSLGGGAVQIGVDVTKKELVESPLGKIECYRVDLSVGQSFWLSADAHRYLVKCEMGALTGKLTAIAKRKLDEPVQFHDGELGVSLTAPPQWVVVRYKVGQPAKQALIRTYDADADSEDGGVRFFETDSLPKESQKSSKAWAEAELKNEIMKLSADVKVRADGWKDYTVAGLPGVSFIADYTLGGRKKTLFSLYVIGPKNSEHFVIISEPEKFDALKKQFEGIIASYRRD
jgi:hypothetical protein